MSSRNFAERRIEARKIRCTFKAVTLKECMAMILSM
jgi:hypothetical protein